MVGLPAEILKTHICVAALEAAVLELELPTCICMRVKFPSMFIHTHLIYEVSDWELGHMVQQQFTWGSIWTKSTSELVVANASNMDLASQKLKILKEGFITNSIEDVWNLKKKCLIGHSDLSIWPLTTQFAIKSKNITAKFEELQSRSSWDVENGKDGWLQNKMLSGLFPSSSRHLCPRHVCTHTKATTDKPDVSGTSKSDRW